MSNRRVPTAETRRRAFRAGHVAELGAAAFLMAKGYRILARRYAAAGGEIDLIARRGRTIAFVEVKRRSRIEDAAIAITADKRRKFQRAVRDWLTRHDPAPRMVLRADAIFLAPWRWPRHVEAAFEIGLD